MWLAWMARRNESYAKIKQKKYISQEAQWDKSIIYIFTMSSHWTAAVIAVVCFDICWLHLNRKSHTYCAKYNVWISHEYIVTRIVLSLYWHLVVCASEKCDCCFERQNSFSCRALNQRWIVLSCTETISSTLDELYKSFNVPFFIENSIHFATFSLKNEIYNNWRWHLIVWSSEISFGQSYYLINVAKWRLHLFHI